MTLVQIMSPLESQLWRGERIIHIMHLNKYLVIILIGNYILLILLRFLITFSIVSFTSLIKNRFFVFSSNNSSDKLLIESALDNTEKIVANILANANQGKRQVVLKER